MINLLAEAFASIDSPETIATISAAVVSIVTAIIAVIKKKVKPGSKEERLLSLAWKYGKEFFMAGKKVGEEECKHKVKNDKSSPKTHRHSDKDGKKT